MKKVAYSLTVALSLIVLASCGGKQEPAAETPATTTEETATTPAEPITLELNAGDDMKYDKTEFTVKAGQKVTLNFHHTGKMAKEAMGHNFVLLQEGVDVAAFGQAAAGAAATGYIPESMKGDIIAHTDLIGGGESTTLEFTAPTTAGNYAFICSFPGHYGMMKGIFIVE
ncbi:MAG TPA: plastocyanin/azurin family copper-binding protein [Taishania sp.]|nr:plastocyanin/azurin family copper-binding protein [Taishania sp.]